MTVTSEQFEPHSTDDFVVVVTFSEPVSGFEMSELEVTNGSAQSMSSNSDGTHYTVTIRPSHTFTGEVTIAVPAGVATDAEGNANTASAVFDIWTIYAGGPAWVDGNPIANLRCTQERYPRKSNFGFNVAFNEVVTGFRLGAETEITSQPQVVTLITYVTSPGQGGASGWFAGGVATPDEETSQWTVTVPAGVATDLEGNPNTASGTLRFAINRTVSVADASATEGPDATMEFTVTKALRKAMGRRNREFRRAVETAAKLTRELRNYRSDLERWVERDRRTRRRWTGLALAVGFPAFLLLGVLVEQKFEVIPLHDPTGGWRGHVWEQYGQRIVDCAVEAMSTDAEVDCPLVVRRP